MQWRRRSSRGHACGTAQRDSLCSGLACVFCDVGSCPALLQALRHLCRLSPAQLWRFHSDTQALAAQQPVVVATTAAAVAVPSSAPLASTTSALAYISSGGSSGGWAAAAEQALQADRRATVTAAPSNVAALVAPLKPPRPSLRALGSRIFRSMLSGGRRRSDDLSALHDHDQQYVDQPPPPPLAVQPRSPVLLPQPVGATMFGTAAAGLDGAPSSPPAAALLLAHNSVSSLTGQTDAFSLELARRRAVAAIARVAALASGKKAGAVAVGGLVAPLVPRSERAVRSVSASAAVAAAAAGLLAADGQRLVVTSKFQPCEDHTPLIDVEALRAAVGHALGPQQSLLPPPPPRADSGSYDGDDLEGGAARGRVMGIGSEAGGGLAGAGVLGVSAVGGCPAAALRRCGTSGLEGPAATVAPGATVKNGQVQDVCVLEEMRRLMMARRRSTAASTKTPPAAAVDEDGPASAEAAAAVCASDAEGNSNSGPAAVAEASKELPQLRLQRPQPSSASPEGAENAAGAVATVLNRAEYSYPATPNTARMGSAAYPTAPHLQPSPVGTARPPNAFAGSVATSTAAAAAAARQPQGYSGAASPDLQLHMQTSQASTALYGLLSAHSLKLPPPSPSTPLAPQLEPAQLRAGAGDRDGSRAGGGSGSSHLGLGGISPFSCASRDGDGEVDIKLAFASAGDGCVKGQGCRGSGATGVESTAAQIAAELAATSRAELRRPAAAGSELVLAALAAQLAEQQLLHGALAVVHIGGAAKRLDMLPPALQQVLGPPPAACEAAKGCKELLPAGGFQAWEKAAGADAPKTFPAVVTEVVEPPSRSTSNPGNCDGVSSSRGYSGSGNDSVVLTCSRTVSSASGGTSLFSLTLGATGGATAGGAAGGGGARGSEQQSAAGGFLLDLADLCLRLEAEGSDLEVSAATADPVVRVLEQAERTQLSHGGSDALHAEAEQEEAGEEAGGDGELGSYEYEERPTWGSAWSGAAAAGARRGLPGTATSSRSSSRRAVTRPPLAGTSAASATAGGLHLERRPLQAQCVHLVEEEGEREEAEAEQQRDGLESKPVWVANGQLQQQPWKATSAAPRPQHWHANFVDVAAPETPREEAAGPVATTTAALVSRPVRAGASADVAVAGWYCGLPSPLRWASNLAARARGRVVAARA